MSNNMQDSIPEEDLHAYIDGHLSLERRKEVKAWLGQNPEEAARIATWQAETEAIRALFGAEEIEGEGDNALGAGLDADHVAADAARLAALSDKYPDPQRIVGTREQAGSVWPWSSAGAVAAALGIFMIGGLIGAALTHTLNDKANVSLSQLAQDTPGVAPSVESESKDKRLQTASLIDSARDSYTIYTAEKRHKVEVGADEKEHLGQWLGNRLNKPDALPIPDLARYGFELIGGRLVPYQGKPSALLIYGSDEGKQLTILVGRLPEQKKTAVRQSRNGQSESSRHFTRDGELGILAWQQDDLGYAVSAPLGREQLLTLANQIEAR